MAELNTAKQSQALNIALTLILRPLVRLLIHYQLTFPYISQLLKKIYLEVAEQSFPVTGKRVTDSRLSLLTGVHRKDVRKLRFETESNENLAPDKISLSAQVISYWLSNQEFCTDDGQAKPLFKLSALGEPSFESLVERVSKQDLHSRSLLDEWLNNKTVLIDDLDFIHLETEALIPSENFDEKCFFLGKNLHDHLAAATHNIINDESAFLDRAVYYNNLTADSVHKLQELSELHAMESIKLVNRRARQLQQKDSGKKLANQRFRFGAYFYAECIVKNKQTENSNEKN